jgi:hypothetical protein
MPHSDAHSAQPSIHSGHYVAHVRQDDPSAPDAGEGADAWVLFK